LLGFFSGVLYWIGFDNVGFEKVQFKLRGGSEVVLVLLRNALSEFGTVVLFISVLKDTGTHVFGMVAGVGVAGVLGGIGTEDTTGEEPVPMTGTCKAACFAGKDEVAVELGTTTAEWSGTFKAGVLHFLK
jgi:hypothetical protein